MIGYFLFGSKSKGLYITPNRSVMPSSALTLNGSGNLYPDSIIAERSVFSRGISLLPSWSYNTDSGAVLTRDELLTKYLPESDIDIACEASPALSSFMQWPLQLPVGLP